VLQAAVACGPRASSRRRWPPWPRSKGECASIHHRTCTVARKTMCLCTSQQKLLCQDRPPPQHVGMCSGCWQRQWVGYSVHAVHTPSDIPTHASDHVHSNLSSAPHAAHHASLINVHTQTHIHNVRVAVSSRLTLCTQQHNHHHTRDVSWQTHRCAVMAHVRTCLVVQLSLQAVSCLSILLNA